uniref:Uncharacterized protein n=1 Tax=Trichogramma kaykai TaxID=54128 RepID=A0ABD2VZV7_9HYME
MSRRCLKKLQTMRQAANWEIEEERQEFLRRLYSLIRNWHGQLPNLRDIFRKEAIDWLLKQCVKSDDELIDADSLVEFVIRTGYKDKPDVDRQGKPILSRTTAIHQAARSAKGVIISDLFKIYERFDVNYTDELGLTHFHVACATGCYSVVEKFLELGQDPNCVWPETGGTPLHLAVDWNCRTMIELLLVGFVDPSLLKKDRTTFLPTFSNDDLLCDLVNLFFKMNEITNELSLVDALKMLDKTLFHLTRNNVRNKLTESLLRRNGADANLADAQGSTPLHLVVKGCTMEWLCDISFTKIFFETSDEIQQTVEVDVQDKLGRTPLQWVVASLAPNSVDALLARGADLANFSFPTEDYFAEILSPNYKELMVTFKMSLACGALTIVGRLEKGGYELDRSDALTIMKMFHKYRLFEKANFDDYWYENAKLVCKAEEIMIGSDLSLHDLIKLRPEQAEKLLAYEDYTKIERSYEYRALCNRNVYDSHLSEVLLRRFCRRWALDSFLELIRLQLPILCCEKIIEQLANKDLWHIFLATQDQNL